MISHANLSRVSTLALLLVCLVLTLGTAIAQDVVRIDPDEATKAVSSQVQPVYPAMARKMKLSGEVKLDIVIAETGSVESVKVLSGNPLLTGAARTALKKWTFTPIKRDGKPVKAAVVYAFNFK